MKRKISIIMIVIGLIMVLIGGIYNIYNEGIINEKWLISTPYLKGDVKKGERITDEMIGYKDIPESEYDTLKEKIYVYSVDITGKCLSVDMKNGEYFYINKMVECEVDKEESNE